MSGRAKKLLQKLEKNKNKVDKNFIKYYKNLKSNPEVFDIEEEHIPTFIPTLKGFSSISTSLQKVDFEFPHENYGLELIIPPGIITASGIRSGDEVEIMGGSLEGRLLEVVDVINATTLRLDNISTFSNQETNIPVKFILNKE